MTYEVQDSYILCILFQCIEYNEKICKSYAADSVFLYTQGLRNIPMEEMLYYNIEICCNQGVKFRGSNAHSFTDDDQGQQLLLLPVVV